MREPIKRVPKHNVVRGTIPIIKENSAAALHLAPGEGIIKKIGKTDSSKYLFSNPFNGIGSGTPGDPGDEGGTTPGGPGTISDAPSLSDIESITYESYLETGTDIIKYRAILKVRNSGIKKNNVIGVDARIYDPTAPV